MKVGVFDSGFGGLTVLRALLERLPGADYVYLGDSARLPYGSKSARTVAHYAASSAKFLYSQGIELLVVACNTASAMALEQMRAAAPVEVIGVIEPGALQAKAVSKNGRVGVLATAATVSTHAYAAALQKLGMEAEEKACPLLVPLVEEGWVEHSVTEQVLDIYLGEMMASCEQRWGEGKWPDTLVLGCTHYPLLKALIERRAPRPMALVDSAEAIAREVGAMVGGGGGSGKLEFFATDSLEKFRILGARFLGREIGEVRLVELPE